MQVRSTFTLLAFILTPGHLMGVTNQDRQGRGHDNVDSSSARSSELSCSKITGRCAPADTPLRPIRAADGVNRLENGKIPAPPQRKTDSNQQQNSVKPTTAQASLPLGPTCYPSKKCISQSVEITSPNKITYRNSCSGAVVLTIGDTCNGHNMSGRTVVSVPAIGSAQVDLNRSDCSVLGGNTHSRWIEKACDP